MKESFSQLSTVREKEGPGLPVPGDPCPRYLPCPVLQPAWLLYSRLLPMVWSASDWWPVSGSFFSPVLWSAITVHVLFTSHGNSPVKMLVLAFVLADIGKKFKSWVQTGFFSRKKKSERKEEQNHFLIGLPLSVTQLCPVEGQTPKGMKPGKLCTQFLSLPSAFCLDCSSWHHKDSHHKRGSFPALVATLNHCLWAKVQN